MLELEQELQKRYGFSTFRPGQKEIVEAVLGGANVLGVLPTGSGKTLCYQLPTALQGGLTVVVEPLLALMDDQVARLQTLGEKRAVALTSRLDRADFNNVLRRLNKLSYLFVSPESLLNPRVLAALQTAQVARFVVDEAHCISQWGPDFRPAYLKLGAVIEKLQPRSVLALTGTAPKKVQEDIVSGLRIKDATRVIAPFNRANVFLGVESVADEKERFERILELCRTVSGAGIIYCATREQTVAAARLLREKGEAAAFYHAGLESHERDLLYRQFMSGQIRLMCATSAFGMGIDKAEVRLVIHTYIPESLEAYTQAVGRAGRDGKQSVSVLLHAPYDLPQAERWATVLPTSAQIHALYAAPMNLDVSEDPQLALVFAYRQAGIDEQTATRLLSERLDEKQESFIGMRDFVLAQGCHRAVLQAHFDAEQVVHNENCCGFLTATVVGSLPKEGEKSAENPSEWENIFKNIFNLSPERHK